MNKKNFAIVLLLSVAVVNKVQSMDFNNRQIAHEQAQILAMQQAQQLQTELTGLLSAFKDVVNNPPIDQGVALERITLLLNRIQEIRGQDQLLFQQIVQLMSPAITSVDDSPLILAVQANMEGVVRFMVNNRTFRSLQGAIAMCRPSFSDCSRSTTSKSEYNRCPRRECMVLKINKKWRKIMKKYVYSLLLLTALSS
ncbi:MAG: hypothetical protein LVQ75_01215 [Candidatus Babeliales bacterium]|jgi:hypothetical protein